MALIAVHDAQRAERITAQVFVDVWWRVAEFDSSAGSVEAWLTTLTRARLIDDLRHSHSERPARSAARTETRADDGSTADAWLRSIRNGGRAIVGRAGVPASAA